MPNMQGGSYEAGEYRRMGKTNYIDSNARDQRKNHPKPEAAGVPQKKDGLGGGMKPQRFYGGGDKSEIAAKPPARAAGYRKP